ncbi:hypothetical protein [Symbiobacterium sp.]|uniref:hypothetical protein n=1 Tax=Symbiobacterium sp. TaxID=1971213 RepID=UPI00346463CB
MAMLTALLISGYHGSLLPRQRQLVDEFLAGIQYVDKMPVAELAARVRSLREHYWASFERSYSYILENYLVHEAYRIGLPLRPGPFDSYARLVLTFALFVFQLIGLSGIHHEITPELAVRVAQCEARKVQHGGDTVQRMADWLRANESYNLATLVILAH